MAPVSHNKVFTQRAGMRRPLVALGADSKEADLDLATTSAPTKRGRARLRLKSDEMFVNTETLCESDAKNKKRREQNKNACVYHE